jgi:hypothetical protein
MLFFDVPPPVEHRPPYSFDFIAHLHGGCYPDDVAPMLLRAVQRDPDGARMLEALIAAQLELRLYGT